MALALAYENKGILIFLLKLAVFKAVFFPQKFIRIGTIEARGLGSWSNSIVFAGKESIKTYLSWYLCCNLFNHWCGKD